LEIPVLIEPVAGNGFRATSGPPLALTAEGATRDEALAKLRDQLNNRLRHGQEVVALEVSAGPHPLAEFAGMFRDDPAIDDWVGRHRRIPAGGRRGRRPAMRLYALGADTWSR
jgi:hypothetical protein